MESFNIKSTPRRQLIILPIRFLQFLKERFKPVLFIPLIALFCGGHFLYLRLTVPEELHLLPVILSSVSMLLFFIVLRLWDDVFDLSHDRDNHPDRPLSCGLISVREAVGSAIFFQAVILGMNAFLGMEPLILAIFILLYQLLSQKDFFIPGQAAKPFRLLLYSAMVFFLSFYLFLANTEVLFRRGQLIFSGILWMVMAGIIFLARRRSL